MKIMEWDRFFLQFTFYSIYPGAFFLLSIVFFMICCFFFFLKTFQDMSNVFIWNEKLSMSFISSLCVLLVLVITTYKYVIAWLYYPCRQRVLKRQKKKKGNEVPMNDNRVIRGYTFFSSFAPQKRFSHIKSH